MSRAQGTTRFALRTLLALGALLHALVGSALTRADRPLVQLEPGGECLDATRLNRAVSAFRARPEQLPTARVMVREQSHPHHVVSFTIAHAGRSRTRVFDPAPERCEEAHSVVALAIALALDDGALETFAAPDARGTELSVLLSAQPAYAYAVLPNSALGGGIGAMMEGQLLGARFELLALHSWEGRVSPSSGRFSSTLAVASLVGCIGARLRSRLAAALCIGAAAGLQVARGSGFESSRRATGPWTGLLAGARLKLGRGPVTWLLDLELSAPLYAPSFRVERLGGPDLAREPAPVGFLMKLGPSWQIR